MKNQHTIQLTTALKKLAIEKKRPLWKRVATDLEKPTRQRRVVNLYKIEQYAKDGEVILIPGKLLGEGVITKKVTIVPAKCSEEARKKVIAAGGKIVNIADFMKDKPDGKDIRVLG